MGPEDCLLASSHLETPISREGNRSLHVGQTQPPASTLHFLSLRLRLGPEGPGTLLLLMLEMITSDH